VRTRPSSTRPTRRGGSSSVGRRSAPTVCRASRHRPGPARRLAPAGRPRTFYGERAAVFTGTAREDGPIPFWWTAWTTTTSRGIERKLRLQRGGDQEFRVLTDGFSPEFGRASGGLLNILTRSGGTRGEGGAFLQIRPPCPTRAPSSRVSLRFRPTPARPNGPSLAATSRPDPRRTRRSTSSRTSRTTPTSSSPSWAPSRTGPQGAVTWLRTATATRSSAGLDSFLRSTTPISGSRGRRRGVRGQRGRHHDPDAGHWIKENDRQLAASLTSVLGSSWFNEARLLLSSSRIEQQPTRP